MQLRERRLGGVLEAMYAREEEHDTWLTGLNDALCALFGTDQTALASYRWHPDRSIATVTSTVVSRVFSDDQWWADLAPHYTPDDYRRVFCGAPVQTMATVVPPDWHLAEHVHEVLGAPDGLGLTSLDADGEGIIFSTAASRLIALQAPERQLLGYLVAHLTSAYRARRHRGAVDAVFTPTGRVAHLEPRAEPALEQLRQMVGCAERARSARASPSEALAAWTAVVQGRWSVLESIDSDGRRFIVAQDNEPRPGLCAAIETPELTPTQLTALALLGRGYPQKAIAYELGLSPSRISRLLAAAQQVLGLASRTELVRVARTALSRTPHEADAPRR